MYRSKGLLTARVLPEQHVAGTSIYPTLWAAISSKSQGICELLREAGVSCVSAERKDTQISCHWSPSVS